MHTIYLNPEEVNQLNDFAWEAARRFDNVNDVRFIQYVRNHRLRLPQRIYEALSYFQFSESHPGGVLIKGYPIDDEQVGPTPSRLNSRNSDQRVLKEEILLLLLNSVLGDVFAWSCQRDGALVNDILPIPGNEFEQLSSGSVQPLDWHIEEAFHPYRPDYLCLLCIRNPDMVPLLFGAVTDLDLPDKIKRVLFQPKFIFLTDKNFQCGKFKDRVPASVLFGSPDLPYVRIDPSFMQVVEQDEEAEQALRFIVDQFNANLKEIILEPGDFCFIDNYRAVHGRKGFVPRYDGSDRWLKRIMVTRDLRKSRDARRTHDSWIIEAN